MGKARLLVIALVILGAGFLSAPRESDAAFHIMRVWEVIGGAYGNPQIQSVELRMPAAGQNIIGGQQVCFFDASGTPKARLSFTVNAPNGPNGASILMGSPEFNSAWAAGSPDFVFGGAGSTMTGLNGFTDLNHPVQFPAGKVGFGGYDANCVPFGLIDSVAYGTGYTGGVDLGSKLNMNLPTSGTQAIKLTGAFCHPNASPCPRSNNVDYSIVDANTPVGNQPRNNVPQQGPLGAIVLAGDSYFETANPTDQDFATNPIPLDFFDPGSQPFGGLVPLEGLPIPPSATFGTTDTIIERQGTLDFSVPFPSNDNIPIEMVQLSLKSVNPITVNYGGPTEQWTLDVSLNPSNPSVGTMNATGANASGGTFSATLQVFPRFTFTRISDSAVRVLDYTPNNYSVSGVQWRYACPAGVIIGPNSTNICAGADGSGQVAATMTAADAQHTVRAACSDADTDNVSDCVDNCPANANPLQEDNEPDGIGDVCDPDDDNDTVLDGGDNCQFIANTNQANFDVDALGDVCDPDDDNDGLMDLIDPDDDNDKVADADEMPCGGTSPSNLRPERIDGVFSGADDDGDTMIDEALPGGGANFDCDGDGFKGTAEAHVYFPSTVADQDPCGSGVIPPTVPPLPLGWAPDLIGGAFSGNRVNTQDLATYLGPVRYYNTDVGTNMGDRRWDILPGSGVLTFDINIQDLATIVAFSPPMLGVKAFNGPMCAWPP